MRRSRLARHILRHVGRHLAAGSDAAWSFLLRTPEMVEARDLGVLADRLGPARVWKGHLQLPGSTLTFNPDLVFDAAQAVGDVKYKLSRASGTGQTSTRSSRSPRRTGPAGD